MSKTVVESPFNISASQESGGDAEARAQLDAALSSFASKAPITGVVNGNLAPSEVIDDEETEDLEQSESEETEAEAEEVEETTTEPEAFDQEFSKRFGIKPEEALETINSLLAFKDEMSLMRTWAVSPTEYDSRISQVREFYKTLPEDKQPEFNSPEGAKAIWQHLETQNSSKKKTSTVSKVGSSKKPASAGQPKEFIKKSEILKMPPSEYQKRLPEINLAWKQGRVLENE